MLLCNILVMPVCNYSEQWSYFLIYLGNKSLTVKTHSAVIPEKVARRIEKKQIMIPV